MIENVQKKETEQIVTGALQAMDYVTQAFFANSASFGLPQSRTRLYVLAVDPSQCHIVHGPDQWQMWLEAGASPHGLVRYGSDQVVYDLTVDS